MNDSIQLPELSFDFVAAARTSTGILAKLCADEVRTLAQRYQRFLALKAMHPTRAIAPTEIIDEMWHLHMLHPRAYHRDCMAFFGTILDHAPGFGSDAATRPALQRTFDRTAELWERTYGEPYSIAGQDFQNLIICADEEEAEEEEEEEKDALSEPPAQPDEPLQNEPDAQQQFKLAA
ncbi:hypothetical protein RugamoR64_52250 [Duganella rhizosphaerae]|uniref:glycine-rich domain-containing protein n=1 Tax=Duganella rhizosphaerae TaxID=2885763 RepID=UPI0030E980AD